MDAKTRAQDWQIIISAWQASDLSGMGFCKANNHAYHKFSYWRRRLGPSTSSPVAEGDHDHGFTQVIPVAPHRQSIAMPAPGTLSVALPNGIIVSGVCAGNVAVLGAILRQL